MGAEVALLAAFAKKLVDFVRQLRGKDTSAVLTQLLAWAAGVAVVFIGAHVDVGSAVEIANHTLDQLSVWSQVVLGVVVGSLGSVGKDALKALDNTQTEKAPKLVQSSTDPREIR
jgi:cytochrome c biogenesis protein CcdA